MSIPESQLETWSNQGSVTSSASTHASLRAALATHRWPKGMTFHTYLQGSYANATNIRGNSDVDLAVQSDDVFYSNLTPEEKRAYNVQKGSFGFDDFRREVLQVLVKYYGASSVTVGDKSLRVAAGPGRLPADVVPCILYKEYQDGTLYAEGMTFWSQSGQQVKNFPKLHIENGRAKNALGATAGWYKPAVRMFKNARERLLSGNAGLRQRAPSYFVECLIYNASNDLFDTSFQSTYLRVVQELRGRVQSDAASLVCQNRCRYLFGSDDTQWNSEDAESFLSALAGLWDAWGR